MKVTTVQLVDMGLSLDVAKRVSEKKAVWLTRMSEEEISRLHEADLYNR
jgi:hypothetical protein